MSRSEYAYRDPQPYALAVLITQGLYLAAVLANLILVAVITATGDPQTAYAGISDGLVGVGYVVAAIAFSVWTWRVVANANTFKPTMNAKPGWAIGWYFVPVASLWKPYQYLEETWDVSAPKMGRDPSSLLRWWWGLWIGMIVVGSFGNAFSRGDPDGVGAFMIIGSVALRVPLILVVMRIATKLAQLQREKRAAGSDPADVFA